jgi:hypothetical protein
MYIMFLACVFNLKIQGGYFSKLVIILSQEYNVLL